MTSTHTQQEVTTMEDTCKECHQPIPTSGEMQGPWGVTGRWWKAEGREWWHCETGVGDNIYLYNDAGSRSSVEADCKRDVDALARILGAGHKLTKTWPELVDEAREE